MREDLRRFAEEHPEQLSARFEPYVEAASMHCGYRIEPARAELEIAFEYIADALARSGALGPKSRQAMRQRLDREANQARTMSALSAAYRRAVADTSEAIRHPVRARQDRSLRGAVEYIHEHYGEPLDLPKVAKVAGFTPKYFSELFRKRERMTFERYLAKLRLDRATQLLSGTDLTVTRVAELSGYTSPQYFCRAFRRGKRTTPAAFRQHSLPHWAKKDSAG